MVEHLIFSLKQDIPLPGDWKETQNLKELTKNINIGLAESIRNLGNRTKTIIPRTANNVATCFTVISSFTI